MSVTGFQAGFRVGMRNATATRSLVGAAFTLVAVALIALAEKQVGVFGAASRALEDRVFGLLLPFVLLYASTRILQPMRLDDAASPIARFGFSRRAVGLGLIGASMVAGAALAAVAAAETALLAHDLTAPPPALDAFNCAWIGALTGCAYAGSLRARGHVRRARRRALVGARSRLRAGRDERLCGGARPSSARAKPLGRRASALARATRERGAARRAGDWLHGARAGAVDAMSS